MHADVQECDPDHGCGCTILLIRRLPLPSSSNECSLSNSQPHASRVRPCYAQQAAFQLSNDCTVCGTLRPKPSDRLTTKQCVRSAVRSLTTLTTRTRRLRAVLSGTTCETRAHAHAHANAANVVSLLLFLWLCMDLFAVPSFGFFCFCRDRAGPADDSQMVHALFPEVR